MSDVLKNLSDYASHCDEYQLQEFELINSAIAEITRLNAIISEMQQIDDVLAPKSYDTKRMDYLSNGGWEVLQDPKYWTDNLNIRQVIDRAIDEAMRGEE